jgi:hypothetical protein
VNPSGVTKKLLMLCVMLALGRRRRAKQGVFGQQFRHGHRGTKRRGSTRALAASRVGSCCGKYKPLDAFYGQAGRAPGPAQELLRAAERAPGRHFAAPDRTPSKGFGSPNTGSSKSWNYC